MWLSLFFACVGFLIGTIFALLFINFDSSWKKILSFVLSIFGSGGFLVAADSYFDINDSIARAKCATAFIIFIFLGFVALMVIMCKLIRDKDDKDILRIRDILLGQKSYIDNYYESRAKEIDEKLHYHDIEKNVQENNKKEMELCSLEKYLKAEKRKVRNLGKHKVKINLPINTNIIISEEFVRLVPSYIDSFAKFYHQVKVVVADGIEADNILDFKAYLMFFASCMSRMIFGGGDDVRIHFRYYNEKSELYEEIIYVVGNEHFDYGLTPIPYNGSMIHKSFQSKRALIKSINLTSDYPGKNSTKWKDYMTYAFHSFIRNGKPYITFGISVKNEEKYKNLFYFLNYIEIENYLDDYLSAISNNVNIEEILYGGE